MVIRLKIFLGACFLLTACQENNKTEILTLANYMQKMQMEYASIGIGIKQNKHDAIAYHANNILTISNTITANQNNNEKLAMPYNTQSAIFIDPIIINLKKIAETNDALKLKEQFKLLTNNCKSCHANNKVAPAFIPIEL